MLHKGDVQPPKRLEEHLATYFPDVDVSTFDWVRDPFTVDLPATAVEQLIELRQNSSGITFASDSGGILVWSKR